MMQQAPPGTAGNKEVSPRKKKGQITFAQSSFLSSLEIGSLDDSNNKKVSEDVQFLYSQLQRAKKDKDVATERCEALELQLQTMQKHFKETSTKRHMEEDAFRRQLASVKAEFDKKLVKLVLKAKDREDLLVDWVSAITDHKLEQQHEHLHELLERTVALLPPSLREMMRRNKNISQTTTTGRTTKTKKKSKAPRKAQKSSVTSADPDALLAIINENISVLDNFNLKHMNFNTEGSDTENLIRGTGYQDYVDSSADEREIHAHSSKGNHYSGLSTKAKSQQAHTNSNTNTGGSGADSDGVFHMNEQYGPGSSPQSRAYTAQSAGGSAPHPGKRPPSTASSREGIRSRGSPKNASRKGGRPRRRVKTPSGGRERGEDSDSGESGTVTGSIMDVNEASDEEVGRGMTVQYEMPQEYGLTGDEQLAHEQDAHLDAALYDLSLSKSLSLTAPDPSGNTGGYYPSHQPMYTSAGLGQGLGNSRTPRSTEVGHDPSHSHSHHGQSYGHSDHAAPQYGYGYSDIGGVAGTGGGSGGNLYPAHYNPAAHMYGASYGAQGTGGQEGGQEEQEAGNTDDDQFIETMRNLQEIVGQRPVSGGGASDKRKMSEMSAQYTDMVRNILDTMSEVSRSNVLEEGGSGVDGGGSGIGREIAAMAGMGPHSPTGGGAGAGDWSPSKPSSRGASQANTNTTNKQYEYGGYEPSSPNRTDKRGAQGTARAAHGTVGSADAGTSAGASAQAGQKGQYEHDYNTTAGADASLHKPPAGSGAAAGGGTGAAVPSSIEALLVQAGVSLDAISNLSDDAQYVNDDYPPDMEVNKPFSPTRGASYSEDDIARMIESSQTAVGNSSMENSDVEDGKKESATAVVQGGKGTVKGKGGAKKKKVAKGKKSVDSDPESDVEVLLSAVPGVANKGGGNPKGTAGSGVGTSAAAVKGSSGMMAAGARALGGGGSVHSQYSEGSQPNNVANKQGYGHTQQQQQGYTQPGGRMAQQQQQQSQHNKSYGGDSVEYSMDFDSVQQSRSKSGAPSGNVSGGGSLASKGRSRAEEEAQYLKLGGDWDSHSETSQQPLRHQQQHQQQQQQGGSYGSYNSYGNSSTNHKYASKR